MPGHRRTLLFGLALYLAALVALVPAALFTDTLNHALRPAVVSDLQGSLWRGEVGSLRYGTTRIDGLGWSLQPWALALGRVQVGLHYADAKNELRVALAQGLLGSRYLRGLDGKVDVAFLQGLTPYRIPALNGRLHFNDLAVTLEGLTPTALSGEVYWRNATLDLGQRVALGDWVLRPLAAEGGGLAVQIQEVNGYLDGEARLHLAGDGRYELHADFKPTARGAHLAQHLGLVMRRSEEGHYLLDLQGQLPLQR